MAEIGFEGFAFGKHAFFHEGAGERAVLEAAIIKAIPGNIHAVKM
ncbi:hypothetical protein [Lentibacter sp. XHP0401]|nr:hypothetical protein [Lentibacter sp. XHP0401]